MPMDKPAQSRAPLIVAIVLLVLPVLYVGSYLALVVPGGRVIFYAVGPNTSRGELVRYRWGDEWPRQIFWPLEKIDRKLRPKAWTPDLDFLFREEKPS